MGFTRWGWTLLLVVAGLGLWLLLGSGRVLGYDIGALGPTLLLASAWAALYGASRMPAGTLEKSMSPGEWKAWIGLAFMLAAVAYVVVKLPLLAGESFTQAPHSAAVARNLVLLLVAWVVLSQVVAQRWKGRVQEDERDREIEAKAEAWGRAALVFCIVGMAVTLGFSPADRLQWATHFMIANLLVFALMWGWLVEYAATAAMYWKDRRA